MKKIISILLILSLLMSTAVFAVNEIDSSIDALNAQLEGKVIPAPLNKIFGDEKINVNFKMNDGTTLIVGLLTENNKFKSLVAGGVDDPSLNVYTTEKVVTDIESSSDPASTLKLAYNRGTISYQAVGMKNKIKFAFISVFMKVSGWFTDNGPEEVVEVKGDLEAEAEEETVEENEDKEDKEDKEDDPVEQEVITGDAVAEVKTEPVVKKTVKKVVKKTGPKTHTVELDNTGFAVDDITVSVGDTVNFINLRTGKAKTALLIGTNKCRELRSKIFHYEESYSWKFDEPMNCVVVGGIFTTQSMKVIVK